MSSDGELIDACSRGNIDGIAQAVIYGTVNSGLINACLVGHPEIVELMIQRGANDWNWGMANACRGGHVDIVHMMIQLGAEMWNWGMSQACRGGHIDIVDMMIQRGADNWDLGLEQACAGGHRAIVDAMIQRGADNWNCGMANACAGGHMDIVLLMIERGADNWNWGMTSACRGGHRDLAFEMLRRGATNAQNGLEFVHQREEFIDFIMECFRRDANVALPRDTPRHTVVTLLWRGTPRDCVYGAACAREVFRELDAVNAAIVIPRLPEALERKVRSYFP